MRWRIVGAVVSGALAGALMSLALSDGVSNFYFARKETWMEEGPRLFWGGHWLLRLIASLAATVWAGFIAGVVARRHGGRVAVAAVAPATFLWAAATIPHLFTTLENDKHILAALLAVATPFVAFRAGEGGAKKAAGLGQHFDHRTKSVLGVRWYHYLWIPFAANFIVAQSVWTVLYILHWVKASFLVGGGIGAIVPNLFLFATYATLILLYRGWRSAYGILSGLGSSSRPTVDVLKFAFGYPLAAVACQFGIMSAHRLLFNLTH